jgi:ribosome biogenesis GTPase / thiamine phosphate phosphatase
VNWVFEPGEDIDLDEDDVRIRPNPKGSRPRTKRRPDTQDLPVGMVLQVHLARYRVLMENGHVVLATLAKELRGEGCVTGDRVAVSGDITGTKDALARIVRIEPRVTALTRSSEESESQQTIVANADQLVIVMAAANPEPKPRLVDRYLVAAFNAGLHPILVLTKSDLADPSEFISNFEGFDLEIITMNKDQEDISELEAVLDGHVSVFVGHSGVGKTTLINRLSPGYQRAVGDVNEVTGKGKHTSSSALALRFRDGWIIDTPGIRTFGLMGIEPKNLLKGFKDIALASEDCPRDCSHLLDAPDCELDEKTKTGDLSALRLDSYRRLVEFLKR